MAGLTIAIAGVRVRLRGGERAIRRVARRYSPYQSTGRPDLALDWREGPPRQKGAWPEPTVERTRGGRTILTRRDFRAEFDGRIGSAVTDRRTTSLDSLLRVVLSELLAERGGLLVHAAAVGEWLFPGPSGSGKTTLGSLAPRRRVLSDELVAVAPRGRRFQICGTPFRGGFLRGTSTERNPLGGIFFLRRRRREEVARLPAAEAAVRLMECVLCFRTDGSRAKRVLRTVTHLVTGTPCFRLSYDARSTRFPELSRRLTEALRR